MLSKSDFRLALESALDQDGKYSWREKVRVRRALRRKRVFNRVYQEIAPKTPSGADFDGILDWFLANWEEILRIILTILPLFV